jgi:hypothetical protein
LLLRPIESAWQSSHLRPADAPCRSPVPARLRQIVDPPSTPAGPCDAISDQKEAEDRFRVGYFFFRRFAGFFALAFAFLFFAIAALLA